MFANREVKAKYESFLLEASRAYLDQQYTKAVAIYRDALNTAMELKMGKMVICILKYMICCCLSYSYRLDDLSEAVMILQTLEKSLKDRFPAIFCLLAQLHCKLYRFDCALDVLNEADTLFKKNPVLETFYIPGSEIPIDSSDKKEKSWSKVREECSTWHKPDAICSSPECNNIIKPYVTPNRNIFINDPGFSGMVIVSCNNKERPCELKFHQSCWKFKKDQMYPVKKVSDKDILGDTCFTPNCMNETSPCVISSIEIIGPDGELKAHVKESNSHNWVVNNNNNNKENKEKDKDRNMSKGAIKKVKPSTTVTVPIPKKMDNQTGPLKNSAQVKQDPSNKGKFYNFDKNTILVVREETLDPDVFAYDPPEKAVEKQFVYSLFYYYIKKENVKVKDAYAKFEEIKDNLIIKDFDIMRFLLDTEKFDLVRSEVPKPKPVTHVEEEFSTPQQSFSAPYIKENYSTPQGQQHLQYQKQYFCNPYPPENYSSPYVQQNFSNPYVQQNYPSPDVQQHFSNPYIQQHFPDSYVKENLQINGNQGITIKTENTVGSTQIDPRADDNIEEIDLDYDTMYDELINDDEEFVDCTDTEMPRNFNNNFEKPEFDNKENYQKSSSNSNGVLFEAGGDAPLNVKEVTSNTNGYEDKVTSTGTPRKLNENKKLKDYIEKLEADLNSIDEENKKLKKELEVKNLAIETLENEQEKLSQKVKDLDQLFEDFQKKYQDVQDDNLKIKEELISLMKEKEELNEELIKVNDPEMKRIELMKNFQEEYQILEDCINKDWEKKLEELDKSLKTELENKVSLLNKCLNSQYSGNNHLLSGSLSQCGMALEILNKINNWMDKTINFKQFADCTEWVSRRNFLQTTQSEHQTEYSRLLDELHSNSEEKYKINDINLKLPSIPSPPRQNISEIVHSALTVFYESQCRIIQNLMKMQQAPVQVAQPYPQPYTQQYPYPTPIPPGLAIPHQSLLGQAPYYAPRPNLMQPAVLQQAFIQQFIQHKQDPKLPNASQLAINNGVSKEIENKEEVASGKVEIKECKTEELKNEKVKKNEVVPSKVEIKECKTEKVEINGKGKDLGPTIDDISEKVNQMKKAFMAIKLNVQEKSALEKIVKTEGSRTKTSSESSYVANSVASSVRNTPRKKISADTLVLVFKKKYPGVAETDLVEMISEIRANHNNSLTGIPVSQILKESESLFPNTQRLHVLRYQYNDAIKSTRCETPKTTGSDHSTFRDYIISPASSCSSLNKGDSGSSRKRTWNTVSQEESKWTANGEKECSICMSLVSNRNCYQLSCGHAFHTQCVKKWLKSDRSCPNCRVMITEDDEFPPLPA